jgi:hypothetical protein
MKQLQALIPETDEERANHDVTYAFVNMDGKITEAGEAAIALAFEILAKACFVNADAHGWYEWLGTDDEPKSQLVQRNFGELCMLFTSEISEAFEAYRDGDDATRITYGPSKSTSPVADNEVAKPEGITAEVADILIRIFDWVGAQKAAGKPVPLAKATIQKHAYNYTRPFRHGGKLA